MFDLLTSEEKDGAHAEGSSPFIGVMRKNGKACAATGGWGLEAFKGDHHEERVVTGGGASCFGCRQAQANRDYVFSSGWP